MSLERRNVTTTNYPPGPGRAFPVWPHENKKYFPCTSNRTNPVGNLLVVPPKGASSTLGGIMLRISRNVYQRYHGNHAGNSKRCMPQEHFYMHQASKLGYANRDKKTSFLWSMLREPTRRFVSEFFHFEVSRKKVEPTDVNFQQYLSRFHYAPYVSLLHPQPGTHGTNISGAIMDILQEYNFIGVTERMDESLVVLKLLMGLELNDILYLKAAKGSGGFDDGAYKGSCVYIVPSFISPGMQDFLDNNSTWKNMMQGDVLMYQAANKSLDMTIDMLGRHVVEKEVQKFQQAMKVAHEICANVTFRCSPGGHKPPDEKNDCLIFDLACGYRCLESLGIE